MEARGSFAAARRAMARESIKEMEERGLAPRAALAAVVGSYPEPELYEATRAFTVRFIKEEGVVQVSVLAPGELLVVFRDATARNHAVGLQGGPLTHGRVSFALSPWRPAVVRLYNYRVRVCLEGVPREAWQVEAVAGLFDPSAVVECRDDSSHSDKDAACMRVWVWMEDVDKLALRGQLSIAAPGARESLSLSTLSGCPELGNGVEEKEEEPAAMLTYDVLLHLDRVMDYTGSPPSGRGGLDQPRP